MLVPVLLEEVYLCNPMDHKMKLSTFISLTFLASNITVAFLLNWILLWIGYFNNLEHKVCPVTCTNPEETSRNENGDVAKIQDGSSVWCYGSHVSNRTCQFKYLCYYAEYNDFIFLHGPQSLIEGIDFASERFNPAVSDMSSVAEHNDRYFRFLDLPVMSLEYFTNITLFQGNNLIFKRFFPDNIMHVFHDDLLPMFQTLRKITPGHLNTSIDTRLVFMEGWDAGPYIDLYKLFSNVDPVLRKELVSSDSKSLVCFQDAHVGVSKGSTWYQYGFEKSQGPIYNTSVSSMEIRQFARYVRSRLDIDNYVNYEKEANRYIILLSRNQNRLIINEVDLSVAIAMEFGVHVLRMSLETHSFKELIEMISGAQALVGMHGSVLVLSMFLPPGAILVELFPFAVNPEHYTPYRTLAQLPGMNVIYKAWRNIEEHNTVSHPDWPREFGGIQHLTQNEQENIQNSKEVPKHFCCKNPHWLYRIFQDTIVDIPSLLSTLHAAFKERKTKKNITSGHNKKIHFPGDILNLVCQCSSDTSDHTSVSLKLSWNPPWNLDLIRGDDVQYEVWIQKKDTDKYMAYILAQTSYTFTENLQTDTEYVVWVRCIVDDKTGPFVSSENCSL